MKRIIFVTSNNTKLENAKESFSSCEFKIIGEKIDLPEIQTLEQEDIIHQKAEYAFLKIKKPLFVDDTAFYIEGYNKFPGTLTKFINKTIGLDGLLKLYEEGQNAYFLTMICYMDGVKKIITKGILRGKLTKKISINFNKDTPLNSVFIPVGYNSPLIELDQFKVGNLHRIRALNILVKKLV
jgi:non-canonical purine NTP pyrophosphatase (RdgB/HAM1 family)